jgi:Double zinc ribbon
VALPLAIFGIGDDGLNLAVNLLFLLLVVIWLALIYWTWADARRRIDDPMLVGCAVAASLFPFVGTLVYTIVRPPEYLEDAHERALEMQAAEARLAQAGFLHCPHCDAEVRDDFLRCPSCMRKLKEACHNCSKPLDPTWRICPYCEAEAGTVSSGATQRRRRRPRPEAAPEGTPEPTS